MEYKPGESSEFSFSPKMKDGGLVNPLARCYIFNYKILQLAVIHKAFRYLGLLLLDQNLQDYFIFIWTVFWCLLSNQTLHQVGHVFSGVGLFLVSALIPRMLPIFWYDMRQYQPCINIINIPILDGYPEVWVLPSGF
jgi:hypothetical protein